MERNSLTPQGTALLKVVHALTRIALAQLLADKTGHHAAHPLLADDCVAGVVDGDAVLEVDALVGRGHGGLLGQEGCGLLGRHCERGLSGGRWEVDGMPAGDWG